MLDHGAGTGALTSALLNRFPTIEITALDPSRAMLARLPTNVGALTDRVDAVVGTVCDLRDRSFDLVCSQLAFMFVGDSGDELRRLRLLAASDATVCITVLGDPDGVVPFSAYWRAAASVIDGLAAPEQYPHVRFANPDPLAAAITASGWSVPIVSTIECWRELDAEDLWHWVSGALPLRRSDGTSVAGVSPTVQHAIREQLLAAVAPHEVGEGRYRLPVHGTLLRATAT